MRSKRAMNNRNLSSPAQREIVKPGFSRSLAALEMTDSGHLPKHRCLLMTFGLTLLTLLAAMPVLAATDIPALIPRPVTMHVGRGDFVVGSDAHIAAGSDSERRVADYFATLLAHSRDVRLPVGKPKDGADAAISFALDSAQPIAEGSYQLTVDARGVRVVAHDEAGLFYGAATLWQLLTPLDRGGAMRVPMLHIADAPRFAWRGLMLDSARHFQSVDEIKQLLDAMALHKLNVFHWHLTDDQGWRIEIRKYPRLTAVGGCRIPAGDGGIASDGSPAPYCGFYTQDQIRDVVRYAAQRHIDIVPEIDVPGHATAAIAAYRALGVSGKPLAVSSEWGVNTNLFNADEATFAFLEDVLAEVVTLFPGRYVHIGGDEAVKDQWLASSGVQSRMRELGAESPTALQALLVKRLEHFLAAHGRRMIGWDEILDGDLPAKATVMSWRGADGGIAAARAGHDVVMAPSSDLYLDYLQTALPDEAPGRPVLSPLREVYAYEPVPAALTAAERQYIIGVQANVWTEHMRSFARVEHAVFPRIAAMAETAWSPASGKDYADFLQRMPAQLQRYRDFDIAYAQTPFEVAFDATADRRAGTARIAISNPTGYADIRYSIDGSAPTAKSQRYAKPLDLALPVDLRASVFVDGRMLAAAASHEAITAESLLTRDDDALAPCADSLVLRLEDDGPRKGPRAIFNVSIFKPCWLWKQADLRGIASVRIRAGRMPYLFELAHDEKLRTFEPATRAHGELRVRAGCDGPVLAEAALPAQPDADGFVILDAKLAPHADTADLCLVFTGDTRPTMWVLDAVTLQEGDLAAGKVSAADR